MAPSATLMLGCICGSVTEVKIIKNNDVVDRCLSEPGNEQKDTNSDKGYYQSHVISISSYKKFRHSPLDFALQVTFLPL